MTSLDDWYKDVGEWHRNAFAWAGMRDVASKLKEEASELHDAETREQISDELADCAIAVFAAAARAGIDLRSAIARKFPRVKKKYPG